MNLKFLIIIVLLSNLSSALDWTLDDCYKIPSSIYTIDNISIYSNITIGVLPLNYSVYFNDSAVCLNTLVLNGSNVCDVDTNSFLGNYNVLCNVTDGTDYLELLDGNIDILDTTTTTTTSVTTTSTSVTGTTTTTTTTTTIPYFYGNITLILANDSFDYSLCYDSLNNCYNKSDAKVLDKDYMIYLIPRQNSISTLDPNWIVYVLGLLMVLVVVIGIIAVFAIPIIMVITWVSKR